MAERNYRAQLRDLANALCHPFRLRMAVCGLTVASAYFGIYGPLGDRIARASRTMREAQQRESAASDTELLRAEVARFQTRLAPRRDPNESVQYVLDGIRHLPLKLVELDSGGSITMGPYEASVLRIQVSGPMKQLDALVAWIETNSRLFRIDSLQVEPPRGNLTEPLLRIELLALKV